MSDCLAVFYLITELDVGGAQKALFRLLERLDRRRYDPNVACLYNGDRIVARDIRQLGIPVIDLGMTSAWRIDALWRFYCLLRRMRPVILHTWMYHANVLGRVVGRLAGVPIIITSRRNVNIGGKHRELLKRLTANLDNQVVAVCDLARRVEMERAGAAAAQVVTIYNGIDSKNWVGNDSLAVVQVKREFGIASGDLLIGSAGRLHPQKGFSVLLRALSQVRDRIPAARLLLVGCGELESRLKKESQALGIADKVIFAGQRTDVGNIVAALDVFVLPSLWEGLPNAILEAMAAGLPVVATEVGGVPEVVVDGETGFLVPPADPDALAQAIIKLLADADLRRRMGQAGQERVRVHFDVHTMVRQTEALYEELLTEKGIG